MSNINIKMIDNTDISLAVSCLICGEGVSLTSNEELAANHGKQIFKVCDKCKEAVMKVRRESSSDPEL